MEKQKRWQLWLIIAVLAVTVYNILPTIIWQAKPLKQPVGVERAHDIALDASARINNLEENSIEWLHAFAKNLGVSPSKIALDDTSPRIVNVTFKNGREAKLFSKFLPPAGALIPFVPAQLKLAPGQKTIQKNGNGLYVVAVERNIGIHITPEQTKELYQFSKKLDENRKITPFYEKLIYGRVKEVSEALFGATPEGQQLSYIASNPKSEEARDQVISLAGKIQSVERLFGKNSEVAKRIFASYTTVDAGNKKELISKFSDAMKNAEDALEKQLQTITANEKKAKDEDALLSISDSQTKKLLKRQVATLKNAQKIVSSKSSLFASGAKPLTEQEFAKVWKSSLESIDPNSYIQTLELGGYSPFFTSVSVDWTDDIVTFKTYSDLETIRSKLNGTEKDAFKAEALNRMLFNSVARASRISDETIQPKSDIFAMQLSTLTGAQALLAMDLGKVAGLEASQVERALQSNWNPEHPDFSSSSFPVRGYETFIQDSAPKQKLGLVVIAPAALKGEAPEGFSGRSVYIVAKGLEAILKKSQSDTSSEEGKALFSDFERLQTLLGQYGYIGYPARAFSFDPKFQNDYVFEKRDYFDDLIAATRENFQVYGDKRFAVLELTDVEQRLLVQNKIEDRAQEDLVKWQEEYSRAQVDLNPASRFTVPAPTSNPYLSNIALSARKYFRGDERKTLQWGLDLSGGKTVRIGLRDSSNRAVTEPEDLSQAVNELYTRINRMGVSERTIRVEGDNIILDFPGSQALSASELVKASAMYFHIVNEKFGPQNKEIAPLVNSFLQEVWNEAVVTNKRDIESINEISWKHLGGDPENPDQVLPKSETAQVLYDNGLRFANPYNDKRTVALEDKTSVLTKWRGDSPSDWQGATHPLIVVFNNFALEGSSLSDVSAGHDPQRGNMLMFSVSNSYDGKKGATTSPQQDLYSWTSQFAEDRIVGTPREAYARGGWRMAVILNGDVVSAPALAEALSSNGSIHGRFTPREINELVADLKAGSLTYTPKILSEQNVSPELGKDERTRGMNAALIALALVAILMIGVYRFAGVIACIAVLINLLIIWGVLQSIGAAITLPGIAAIVLTIGMAVDANVLVFERIREEFKLTGRIASAVSAGYKKAFSAIVDSNITTLLAAFILIQFDSGPIKGFAITLIIGILSSMFTALFMTRFFFAGWVQNPNNKELKMAKLFGGTNFNFLKYAKPSIVISVIIMLVGSYVMVVESKTIFGMDFTGGYSLTVDLNEKPGEDYRNDAKDALFAAGAKSGDVEVRELSRPNQLRIQLGISMEEPGHPFASMPTEDSGAFNYSYQANPRITWVVESLAKAGLVVQDAQLSSLDKNWSVMSGQLSDAMRNNALMALGAALLGVLLYITFRFEFKYGAGALVALIHDVWITLGIVALLHMLGVPIEIDLQAIGAIMTIIGYSLNDTIIVFDRIREETKLHRKWKFEEVINHALNVTLNRTLMTSGTTLLVLASLTAFGGSSIFGFSLIMTLGVLVGTISSLFVASPIMLWIHKSEENRQKMLKSNS